MKLRGLLGVIGLLAAMAPVWAGFEVPQDVYRMSKYDDAKSDAQTKGLPIAYLYSDEKTSCGLCSRSSVIAIDQLARKTVLIYVSSRDWGSLPRPVQEALNSPDSGKYIPKTVVFSADHQRRIAIVPYAREPGEQTGLYRDALSAIRKDAAASQVETPKQRVWTDARGRTISATLLRKDDENVYLKTADGKEHTVALAKLSAADQAYVQRQ